MIIIDLNLLIYAVNRSSAPHEQARKWLEEALNGTKPIGIPWIVLLGFLRIITNGKIFPTPLSESEAIEIIDLRLNHPLVSNPEPEKIIGFL